MDAINEYIRLRKLHVFHAYEYSGMSAFMDRLIGYVCVVIAVIGVLYLISDHANAAPKQEQQTYIRALEKVVAACLSDGTGKTVFIGGEQFLCGIVPTGAKL